MDFFAFWRSVEIAACPAFFFFLFALLNGFFIATTGIVVDLEIL